MSGARGFARFLLVSSLVVAGVGISAAEVAVPPDDTTGIVRGAVDCTAAMAPEQGWAAVPPLAVGTGAVTSMQAVFDGTAGNLLIRVVTANGAAPKIFLDVDRNRVRGGWTYQTHVSAAAWNFHVDEDGKLFAHDGAPDEWQWVRRASPPDFGWHRDGAATVVCLPPAILADGAVDPRDVGIGVEHDDAWLPHPFLAGANLRSFDARPAATPVATPGRLAFAYQWAPWAVRGCPADGGDLTCAVDVYGRFAHVVFGGGIDDPDHPSHASTRRLIGALRDAHPDTEIWGYVSTLRHGDVAHDTAAIDRRSARWQDMGVTGIFLDEFDLCDPGWANCARDDDTLPVTRARQREAVAAVHDRGLAAFANAHSIHGALGTVDGEPTPLGDGDGVRPADMYLLENPTIWDGNWWTGLDRLAAQARFRDAVDYVASSGVRLAVVDTGSGVVADDADDPGYVASWWRAVQAGAHAHAYTNAVYSASDELGPNLPVIAPPNGAELLTTAERRFLGGIELRDGGDRAQRAIIDCAGRLVGEIVVDVDDDGAVHARPVVVPATADCPPVARPSSAAS